MKITKQRLREIITEELNELFGRRTRRKREREGRKDYGDGVMRTPDEFNAWAASKMRDAEERDEESH